MDADADPVAQYTNANVKDGLFNYAGAALKSIHTAVHVQYIDKYDGYRAKTEYVADNEAIARYGLNIKQITAFGCDSRGQAARFGAWTLQTELRQQNAVTFEIGREGLKHLPYDIVQIMDNQYAGAELSGRVAAISGNVLTLDRPVSDAVGALVFYSEGGSLKSAKITAAAGNKVTLEREVPLQAGDTWVLSGKVKPRLYRAIGIKENTDAGTYTVTALLHDPKKYAAVDSFAHFDHEITTLHNTAPVLTDAAVNTDGGTVVVTWDNLAANGQVLTYDIKIYRNNSLYRHIPDAQTAEIRLENLPNGNYRAEIRGRNARGVLSAPLVKAWSIDYTVTGLRTTPKTLSVTVDWVLPQTVVSDLVFELWYSKTNNLQTATKLASLAYPQNSYTLTGVGVADVYYFWVRIRDIAGNTGEFTAAVQGRADNNPAPIVQQIQGAIGKSALSRELIDTLNRDMAAAAGLKVSAEAAERAKALQEEARARTAAIQAESSARTAELARKSSEIGTRIAATEAVNEQQAQQIQTVTSAQGNTAAGLEAEKKARTDGDRAEAQARETLAVRLGNAESGISALRETVTRQDAARSSEINTLTAKLENVEVGGRNYALSTGTAGKVLTASENNQTKTVTIDVSSALDLKQGDSLIISCDIELVNATSPHGKPYPRIGAEFSVIYADNSVGYFAAWYGEAVSGTTKTLKQRIVAKHTVAKEVKALRSFIVQARYQTSESIKVSNVKLERGTVATDWSPAPEDSNADTSALTTLSAKVQQASSAVAEIGGKIQSLYTLKTEAIAGGRRAVAGVAVGADGKTGSGEILLMADKVAYVDPKDKTVTPAFVTVIENGKAKQALNGDLFATGSILAKHIAANQTIEAPTLNGATVNAGLIKGGTIRGARIEAVDLEVANIIGDVVAVRTFELKQSPLGYQELICQIPDSRKTRRTVIVPPVFAVAENGAVVSLQLHMDGVIQREVTIQSPEKRIARNKKFSVWVPGPPPLYIRTPQEVPLSFSVPFHLPKTGSISFQKGIDGAAHSLHILCRISGNFDYSPLGDLSGIVCLIV
ncbi:phage tail protein [Neisseria meningitidis]|nr:phage tail protein [Neisseria meningitidis]ELK66397.1 phage tail family protein [Neisseria meningitidis 97021]ELK72863.1 phage tail family protein [Neisseria meningitidis 2006087]ELK77376.1 phage tail family protein [Neisseria meningitidis 2002038]ELK78892.1 phage tail family protein [Neisseria meningitidis 97014]EPF55958.1 phage tail family protein [Neisseria meningitidis 98002]